MNDKLKHFIVAVVITWVVLLASHLWFPLHYNWDFGLAAAVAIMVSAGKEMVWDKWWGLGTPELDDFFWGFVGAVVGPAVWMIGEMILGVAEPLPW
jgi:hypothetical protein